MKELSIEDKAKRYDDLLVKLQEAKVDNDVCDERYCCVIDDIVPELKKKEDQRIRKDLIAFLEELSKLGKNTNFDKWSKFNCAEWIAWVEKQGEQKPAEWLQEFEDKLANATPEQLAEWKEKYFKEEPAEWSEEDEENLKWFEKFFRAESVIAEGKDIPQDRYLWFKSLKGRVQPQPKQEWSEEDAKMMKNIIDDIHCGTNFNPEVMHAANERVKWFKSICLRYQSKWKPSEGQLECLGYAVDKAEKDYSPLANNRIYLTLKALKEQLKKL